MSKKTAEAIVVSGNDYVLQVKGNQPKLKKAITEYVKHHQPTEQDESYSNAKSRKERRVVSIYSGIKNGVFDYWCGLNTIVVVKSITSRKQIRSESYRYYISSCKDVTASEFNTGTRGHWSIENNLHWVKDVVMKEDKSLLKNLQIAENLSMIKNTVLNLYRVNGYKSLSKAIEIFTNRISDCVDLISNKRIYIKS